MASTSHATFDARTSATEVATAFSSSIRSRTILITGVNKLGLGYAAASAFASQNPKTIILASRSSTKLEECLEALSLEYPDTRFRELIVDLSSQRSVRRAAQTVLEWSDVPTIDTIINNAGVMMVPERTLSEDNIEMHLATNHVGHCLLTNLLASKMIAAAKTSNAGTTRIVNVSSLATFVSGIRFSDIDWSRSSLDLPEKERPNMALMKMSGLQVEEGQSYIPMAAYGSSKTANALFSVALNKMIYRRHGILSISLHPGEVASELQRYVAGTLCRRWTRLSKCLSLFYNTLEGS